MRSLLLYKKRRKTMKKLTMFQRFDFAKWQDGKRFIIQGVKYNDKKGYISLDVIIVEDNTDYGDPSISNVYEKFKVHLVNETDEDDVENYRVQDEIIFKGVGKCSVWGDYNSNLSVEAEVEVVK